MNDCNGLAVRGDSVNDPITDHVELARKFLERSRGYLADDDLHQASEKGWGAAAHIVKGVAAANGWEYEHHDQFDMVVQNARQRYRQPGLRQYGDSAESLHRNYYRHPSMLDAGVVRERIDDVEMMVSVLESLIT